MGNLVWGYEDGDSTRTGTATPGVVVGYNRLGFGGLGRYWHCDWVGRDRARTGPGDYMRTNRLRLREAPELCVRKIVGLFKSLPFGLWQLVVTFMQVERMDVD